MKIPSGTGVPATWWKKQISLARIQAVLKQDDGFRDVVRVKCARALTAPQMAVVKLLAAKMTRPEIAKRLALSERAVNFYIADAALRIPGDLPAGARAVMWYRGVPLQALTGESPQATVDSTGRGNR